MTIRDIAVAFGFEVDKKSERDAESSIKGLKSLATSLLGAIGIGFSIAGLSNLAEAAAEAEALESQFSQVFGDIEEEAAGRLETIADNTGVVVNRMKGSFVQISAFAKTTGMETAAALNLADRSMTAVADSAAFYDRSLEEVTDSLQSFLKGNYENDASLGLSCTEVTRNTAANELYGKSFKDLAEDQKQLTLLKMVEDANKASGALGQAARESDTWTNQLGNLKQNLQDFKAVAGSTFLKPAVAVLKILSNLTKAATDKLEELTGESGALTLVFDRMHAIVKRLKPSIDRMMQTLSRGAAKGMSLIKSVADRLGGIENALKLAAVAAASFFAVMSTAKIMGLIKAAGGMVTIFKNLAKVFSLVNLEIMAIVAAVVILALILEDFINFLLGNDSVIGTFFDKAGIGSDNARQVIIGAWEKVRDFLLDVWDFIKQAAGMFADTVKGFFEKHSESIRQNFERAWGIIKTFLEGVWVFISQLAETLFGDTEDRINGSTASTKDKLLEVWGAVLQALTAIWDALYEVVSAIFNAIATVIETVFGWIQIFWSNWGAQILSWFKTLWDSLGGILNGFLEMIKGVANFISSVFTGDWQGAWEAIKQIFFAIWSVIVNAIAAVWETIQLLFSMALSAISAVWSSVWGAISGFFMGIWNGIVSFLGGIWNNIVAGVTGTISTVKSTIVEGLTAAIDWIKSLPENAVKWGSDIIDGIVKGIKGAIGKVGDAVKGIAEKITSFLHFSVPDEGPLTAYESWMPDFMKGLAKGIGDNDYLVLDKVRSLTGDIAMLIKSATANVGTAAAGAVNNVRSSVTQNVNIDNTYNGGGVEAQKNVSRAMKKSATDATTEMARALEYARG